VRQPRLQFDTYAIIGQAGAFDNAIIATWRKHEEMLPNTPAAAAALSVGSLDVVGIQHVVDAGNN
jgi:hypothetical protein